jgi:alkylglycerol monooxygenase
MGRLDTSGYYALGVPIYLLVVLLELWLTRRRGLNTYRFADSLGNLSAGLGEVMLGLFLGPLLIALYDFGYENYVLIHWQKNSIASWVLAFLASDLCYYWYHRAGHRVGVFWAIHGVHHQSQQFNMTIAMRHPWFSDFYSAPFYAPLPLLGVNTTQFFIAISLISFYSLTIHSKTFNRSALYILTTPVTHIVHHSTNPRYLGRNLGAMFTLWDRLFGTYIEVAPDDPPRIGSLAGYETHNGATAQWILWRDLWQTAKQAKTMPEKLRVFFGRPGWRPRYLSLPPKQPPPEDASLSLSAKLYVLWQFTVLVFFATYVLWLREAHPFLIWLIGAGMVLWGIFVIGSLLDQRAHALLLEWLRLGMPVFGS